jgi:hypothetical protein
MIEEQLEPNSASSFDALEHDETYSYRQETSLIPFTIILISFFVHLQ